MHLKNIKIKKKYKRTCEMHSTIFVISNILTSFNKKCNHIQDVVVALKLQCFRNFVLNAHVCNIKYG